MGIVHRVLVVILVDLGSTYCFINSILATKIKLMVNDTQPLAVKIANGDMI